MEPESISDNLTLLARLLLQLSISSSTAAAAATLLFLRISLEQRRGIIPFSCASTILLSIYFPPFFLPWCSLRHRERSQQPWIAFLSPSRPLFPARSPPFRWLCCLFHEPSSPPPTSVYGGLSLDLPISLPLSRSFSFSQPLATPRASLCPASLRRPFLSSCLQPPPRPPPRP